MKHLSKVIGIVVLMLSIFACSNPSDQVTVEQQEKGTITTTHSADRTTTYTILSGTVILPSGTYDWIQVSPGATIYFSSSVQYNVLVAEQGTATTLTIPTGNALLGYQQTVLGNTVTVENHGTYTDLGVECSFTGVFNNYGTHRPYALTVAGGGKYYNKSGGYLKVTQKLKQGSSSGTGVDSGKFHFAGCSTAEVGILEINGTFQPSNYFLTGQGIMKATTTNITNSNAGNGTNTKLCSTTTNLSGTGSTAGVVISCIPGC